jgi:hypothetical protein
VLLATFVATLTLDLELRLDPHGVEVDDCICHRREVRGLGDEELLPVAAEPKDLALHRHEHALVFWIEWPIGLVGEERIESPSGVLGQVQGDRARQAGVDEGSLTTAHQAEALATARVRAHRPGSRRVMPHRFAGTCGAVAGAGTPAGSRTRHIRVLGIVDLMP